MQSQLADPTGQEINSVLAESVEVLARLNARAEAGVDIHQRSVERMTRLVGRPFVLYAFLATVAAWVLLNMLELRVGHVPPDPPPFYWLQGAISFCSLLVTTIVLITQNRQGKLAERRAHLDLQVSLLAEQKVAKLIALVEELRRDLPNVQDRTDPIADAMSEASNPEAVLAALEEVLDDLAEGRVEEDEAEAVVECPPSFL